MASADEENPNSRDLPSEGQQVMSGPSVTAAHDMREGQGYPMMNGVRGSLPRGPMDLNDEVVGERRAELQRQQTLVEDPVRGQRSVPVTSTPASADHFLSSGPTVTNDIYPGNSPGQPTSGRAHGSASDDVQTREPPAGAKANFLSGMARAVSSFPAAVEGMVQRTQAGLMGTSVHAVPDVDGFASAQSGSPGESGRPPSEGQVPRTPLFDQRSWERLVEMPGEAPLLFPRTTPRLYAEGLQGSGERASSTHSSDIQAEVRRQLAEFMAAHGDESVRLRRQVETLVTENRELRQRVERAQMRASGPGLESSGLPGLGWFGRGIGSILGGVPKTGSSPQTMDLRSSKPAPPPPPPTGSHRLDLRGPEGSPPMTPSPVVCSVGEVPRQAPAQHHGPPPDPAVSRHLIFESPEPLPPAPPEVSRAKAQGTSHDSALDPLSVVLTGMAQLQGMMSEIATSPKSSVKSEVIKPGIPSLPDLPPVSQEACLEFSDWLHNSRPALADVSDSSEELWEHVIAEAGKWYSDYLRKPPLERLTMKPVPSSTILQPKWTRVSRRIEGMLIAAAPAQVRDELSAARVSGILPVLCRLYVIYAPGGLSEREIGLRHLQDPPAATSAKEAVFSLRKWQRWGARMRELGGVLPDPAIRVKALEKMTKGVLVSYPDIGFRINLTRAALQIDSTPDDSKVDQLHAQLLSELEVISHRGSKDSDRPRDPAAIGAPKVRGVEQQDQVPPPPKPPKHNPKSPPKAPGSRGGQVGDQGAGGSRPQCTFFLSPAGCKKGQDCTFSHDWNAIPSPERGQRCKGCGGKGHRQSECKAGVKVEEKAKAKSHPKQLGVPKATGEVPQPPPPPNRDAVLKSMLADAATILQQTVPVQATEVRTESSAGNSPTAPRGAAGVNAGTGATPQANAVTPGTPVSVETLAAQLESIRALARGFDVRTCIVDEVLTAECAVSRVLLDSGATHPVIPFREELGGLEKVSVTLAGDGKQQWLRTKGGTLVVPPSPGGPGGAEPPQSIVPLGALVESLGCSVTWSKRRGLRVVHPRLGLLKTGVARNTCPYVQEQQALELIKELEMKRLHEFESQVQNLECELQAIAKPTDPTEALHRFVDSGSRSDALRAVLCQPYLEGVPEAIKVRLAEDLPTHPEQGGRHIIKRLPLPRSARRTLLGSTKWIVHLCSGKVEYNDKVKKWAHDRGCEVLQIDVLNKGGRGWDLTSPEGVWSVLLWAAAEGRIITIFSSPPHRTWTSTAGSSLKGQDSRTTEDPWCVDCDSERTLRENLLAVQDMFLWSVASVARGAGIPFVREFPDVKDAVSLWNTTSWIRFQQWAGAHNSFLETGRYEGVDPLHLCIGTNLRLPPVASQVSSATLDKNTKWTDKVKDKIIRALEGKAHCPSVEELDKVISEGIRVARLATESHRCEGQGLTVEKDVVLQRLPTVGQDEEEEPPEHVPSVCAAKNALDKKQERELELWRTHLENGHVPFRRDCQHCILGSAVNMQHRRVKHPTSYTLSVDLFGPLQPHERGQDEESVSANPHIKYGLVGAFRLPKSVGVTPQDPSKCDVATEIEGEDHLSDYEPSEPEQLQPIHDTLGEVPQDLFEELFGDVEFSDHEPIAAEAVRAEGEIRPSHGLPWEDEVLPTDDSGLLEYVEGLKQPVEQIVLRYYLGLKSKSGGDVTAGVQRLVLHINREYPVRTLHCDPGTEFTSDRLKSWMADQGIRIQHTLPTDKKGNGLAERTVGLLKAQARTHLSSASLSAQFWPLAMRYACEMHNRSVRGRPLLPMFGQRVLHKVKKASGSLNEMMNRWIPARYLAPHLSIPDGHVLITDEGNLVASKGFRAEAIDPTSLPGLNLPVLVEEEECEADPLSSGPSEGGHQPLPSGPIEESVPKVRVRTKSKVRFVESSTPGDELEEIAKFRLLDEDFSETAFHQIVGVLQNQEVGTKDRRGNFEGRYVLGAFCHGGQRGVTSVARRYPHVVKFLNRFLKTRMSAVSEAHDQEWATILLAQATDVPVHRDFRNEWDSKNFIAYVPSQTQLWTESYNGHKGQVDKLTPDWESEKVVILSREAQVFDARNHHAVRKLPDWFVVGFTPLGAHKLAESDKTLLREMRFSLSSKVNEPIHAKMVMSTPDDDSSSVSDGSSGPPPLEPIPTSYNDASSQWVLDGDLQEDSVTPIVGWDPNRDPSNVPELNLEEMTLESFLAVRGVSGVGKSLQALGVESPADLPFLYREDLVEFGVPVLEATLIMKGIHPEGTLRPDNPNLCALRTGEVRLFDRRQRPLPWVFQNRTLDWRSPGPPVQGLGIRQPDGNVEPGHVDWELEEARRRGELPNLFEEQEELRADHADSPRPRVPTQLAWEDDEDWPEAAHVTYATDPGGAECHLLQEPVVNDLPQLSPLEGPGSTAQAFAGQEELRADQADSPKPRVLDSFSCKTVRVTQENRFCNSARFPGSDPVSIGIPIDDPTAVFQFEEVDLGLQACSKTTSVQKVDESLYTENVETILGALTEPLRVVYNVSPAEVRHHLDRWVSAARSEVEALADMKAITRLFGSAASKARSQEGVQVLPAKTVFTVKPGSGSSLYRRKCRVVGCGNFESKQQDLDLYASGVPADVLRSCLAEAAVCGFAIFITDVKNAFLRATIPDTVKGSILLRPPRILEQMNITVPEEIWVIEKAVYGLRQSPKWWADYRDAALAASSWEGPSGRTHLKQSTVEPNLWKIKSEDGRTLGLVIVYVDDVMIISSKLEAEALYEWVKGMWECTPLETASPGKPVTFLGVEVHVVCDSQGVQGFALSQEAYILELLRTYDLPHTMRNSPLPREWVKDQPAPEEGYTTDVLRRAQKVTGELLWLSQRTRVDLAYSVALMGSWCSKAPEFVCRMGLRILEFLGSTATYRLSLVPKQCAMNRIVAYSDASFAPYGNHSVTGVIIDFRGCPVVWKSKRQALVALSTAESELISACEAVTIAMSTEALVTDISGPLQVMHLLVDNTAAIALAEGSGTQRTRHLRVRSHFIKEMLARGELEIRHCPGDVQLADALTKVLPGSRHSALCSLLGLGLETLSSKVAKVLHSVASTQAGPTSEVATNLLVLMLVFAGTRGCQRAR